MMRRDVFNQWLVDNKIPSIPISKNLSLKDAKEFKEELSEFLGKKHVNWHTSKKRPNASWIGDRKVTK